MSVTGAPYSIKSYSLSHSWVIGVWGRTGSGLGRGQMFAGGRCPVQPFYTLQRTGQLEMLAHISYPDDGTAPLRAYRMTGRITPAHIALRCHVDASLDPLPGRS